MYLCVSVLVCVLLKVCAVDVLKFRALPACIMIIKVCPKIFCHKFPVQILTHDTFFIFNLTSIFVYIT